MECLLIMAKKLLERKAEQPQEVQEIVEEFLGEQITFDEAFLKLQAVKKPDFGEQFTKALHQGCANAHVGRPEEVREKLTGFGFDRVEYE